MPDVGEGYLVLADVSGYTGFLAGMKLEHASAILTELIQELPGPGDVIQCHHGASVTDHTIVDWRPFSFSTEEVRPGAVRRRFWRTYAEKELRTDLAQLAQAILADAA